MNKKGYLLILSFSISISFNLKAKEAVPNITQVIVFGDSLSDNGNYLKASKSSDNPMPLPPYYEGRASNGHVWTEYFAKFIGARLDDRAYLGALTSGKNPRYPAAVDMVTQIDNYLNSLNGKKLNSDNTLYVVWAGANNIFTIDVKSPLQTTKSLWNITGDIIRSVERLKENGARYILVSNLPDLGKIALTEDVPDYKNMGWFFTSIIETENFILNKRVTLFSKRYQSKDFKLLQFDAKKMLLDIKATPLKYNIKNTTNSCYVGVPSHPATPNVACKNPKDYLFWDLVHPTTKIHCIAAYEIQKNSCSRAYCFLTQGRQF